MRLPRLGQSAIRVCAGLLCSGLFGCGAPAHPLVRTEPAASPTVIIAAGGTANLPSTPTASATPTATARPTGALASSDISEERDAGTPMVWYEGCWELETEDVSFEVRLKRERAEVQGSFLLVRLCSVANELTACRIREGTLQGTFGANRTVDLRLIVSEYDDEGRVRLTPGPDGRMLHWEEIDYPELGLADPTSRFLPQSFDLAPCSG